MTCEELLEYGFKEYKSRDYQRHERSFQLCRWDEKGKRFYVNVRFWQHSKYSTPDMKVDDGFDAYCQFNTRGEQRTFNVELFVRDMTPEEIVNWFDMVFEKMECSYYELYGE